MEKHKQFIAKGSWNSIRISKQVKHAAGSLLFIPDKLRACGTCLSWYIYIWTSCLKGNSTNRHEGKKKNTPQNQQTTFLTHSDFPPVLDGDGLVQQCACLHISVPASSLSQWERKKAPWVTVYCKSLLVDSPEYCPFLKRQQRGRLRNRK